MAKNNQRKTLLLTGPPGVGKTTVIRRTADALRNLAISGFRTDEICSRRGRTGFRITTFDGRSAILAHTGISSPHRVGRYGVDIEALDRIVESELQPDAGVDLFLVDEIGKMECFSDRFVTSVHDLLEAKVVLVATIQQGSDGFVGVVKQREDIEIWEVTFDNRDSLPTRIVTWIRGRIGS
ncbi:MAG: AAA family ATPase [Candidatus Eisenbacteria bacterium]|nr:AAA family ATPase [Candidatus Latescibacterota bacterium]MBD3301420.1 AAA family ATPase [Candidatus Eisenbacteria bacterium]